MTTRNTNRSFKHFTRGAIIAVASIAAVALVVKTTEGNGVSAEPATAAYSQPTQGYVVRGPKALPEQTVNQLVEPRYTAEPEPVEAEVVEVAEQPVQEVAAPVEETYTEPVSSGYSGRPYGSYGRIRIPAVGIDTAVYYVDSSAWNGSEVAQSVVNAGDSAAFFYYDGVPCIADHAYQGFSALYGLGVGSEVDIDNPDGTTTTYTVGASYAGTNYDGYLSGLTYGTINLYTCLDNAGNIWIVTLQ